MEELDALGLPEGDEEQVEENHRLARRRGWRDRSGPERGLRRRGPERAEQIAEDYGFDVCGEE
ncbi:MAG TPA: hypothetical protein VJU14_11200 [Solirubrobacterales bacterium]|nr:hypothetical protein [Solirubrobacterales bacterium]